jgi:hypothetical protein
MFGRRELISWLGRLIVCRDDLVDGSSVSNVVARLIRQGIPSVPIHDGILVQAQYEGEVRDAFNFGWYTQNPPTTRCKIEKKPRNAPAISCGGGMPGTPSGRDGWTTTSIWSSVGWA